MARERLKFHALGFLVPFAHSIATQGQKRSVCDIVRPITFCLTCRDALTKPRGRWEFVDCRWQPRGCWKPYLADLYYRRTASSNHAHNATLRKGVVAEQLLATADALPPIPGGWSELSVPLGDHDLILAVPALPDAFLDDAAVHARHAADGYMPYWGYLWPTALTMAAAVVRRAPALHGARVLEIGAGIGLTGLAALSTCQCRSVTFSDHDAVAVETALHNATRNGVGASARGLVLDWHVEPAEDVGPFEVIIGSDVIYEDRNHGPILALLDRLLAPGGVCWIGDPTRMHAPVFIDLARQHGFEVECESVKEDDFSPTGAVINIWQLRRT